MLRVIGVVVFLYGVESLISAPLFRLGYFNYQDATPGSFVIFGICYGLVGLYLMRGAAQIVSFAYPPAEEDEEEPEAEDEDEQNRRG